ncbi:SusD/RagB family nutrient-binding outer membrane lipoprotein [Elizabethkingia sp. JS20170427COW]|uniref:SusD/RagB family nutrient-binding outer membrane lipoprotein n=1 Tax=Elizabethkingia sp. JS20170427COW TaxID=2583851 RepID=UPI0011104F55|nr:SusD/RagB family nutrient-binding outer membrane lipoprotein [Elizabethkingia sp. JS20170427COW]QCX52608.1 SusD/RagB family nutrient-binding outer membrane lipoprotein [Elizabethkingia sp. JS20170427COW]
MKKNIIRISLALSTLAISLSSVSCTNEFEEINADPNKTDKPLTYGLFNNANKQLMDGSRSSFESGRLALPWMQYSAQRNYTEEDRYQYRITSSQSLWSTYYMVAADYKKIIELNTDPATASQMSVYGPNNNQIAAARVMLSYVFLNLADTFGDVPYYSYGNKDADFQALGIESTTTPKFASQLKIYTDILKELKEASDMITTGDVVFTTGDHLFGSGEKLKRFANSLRLRVATRVKGVVPGADIAIQEAIASGVMQSNDDNVGLKYENNLVNPSPIYSWFIGRSDFDINKTFTEVLKGKKGNFGQDPRLFKFAAPVGALISDIMDGKVAEETNPDNIQGMPYGIPSSLTASQRASSSYWSSNVIRKDYTEILMEYSEVEFLLCEANGWDDTHYKKAVQASLEKWNVEDSKITQFVNSLPPANKANVLNQKWIALFMQPYEAWAEYRRTGYPNLLLLPGQQGQLNDGTPYTFTSLISGLTDLPTRIYYPTSLPLLNSANYNAAVSNMGADDMKTKLIWDKN